MSGVWILSPATRKPPGRLGTPGRVGYLTRLGKKVTEEIIAAFTIAPHPKPGTSANIERYPTVTECIDRLQSEMQNMQLALIEIQIDNLRTQVQHLQIFIGAVFSNATVLH